jgi:hypothetical protein
MVFSVSSPNKTDCHNITEILLKVALNTINQPTWFLRPDELTTIPGKVCGKLNLFPYLST